MYPRSKDKKKSKEKLSTRRLQQKMWEYEQEWLRREKERHGRDSSVASSTSLSSEFSEEGKNRLVFSFKLGVRTPTPKFGCPRISERDIPPRHRGLWRLPPFSPLIRRLALFWPHGFRCALLLARRARRGESGAASRVRMRRLNAVWCERRRGRWHETAVSLPANAVTSARQFFRRSREIRPSPLSTIALAGCRRDCGCGSTPTCGVMRLRLRSRKSVEARSPSSRCSAPPLPVRLLRGRNFSAKRPVLLPRGTSKPGRAVTWRRGSTLWLLIPGFPR